MPAEIFMVAGTDLNLRPGYEPTSYQLLYPATTLYGCEVALVPETGIEPVRSVRIAGF